MNKKRIFRIKNGILAILLSAGMILGMAPQNFVHAQETVTEVSNQTAPSFGEVFIESGYTGWTDADKAAGGIGTLTYAGTPKLRARSLLSDYTYKAGDVLTVKYDANFDCSGISVLLCNKNDSGFHVVLGSLTSGALATSFILPETEVFNDEIKPLYVRFQGGIGAEGDQITFKGITIGSEQNDEEETTEEPENPQTEEESKEPVVSFLDSDGYALSAEEDGSVKVTYSTQTWHTLKIGIENCDYTKYSKVIIDITPYEGMLLGIRDSTEKVVYRDHWGGVTFENSDRQTISFDLTSDTDYLRFYCDPPVSEGVPSVEKSFIIHSIKVVDPTEEGKLKELATFTTFKADEDTCIVEGGKDGIGTISYTKGARVKARAYFEGYKYKTGDVLVFDFDRFDNLDAFEQIIIGYSTSDKQYVTLQKPEIKDNTAVFKLPADGGIFDTVNPTFIRFKGVFSESESATAFNGFHIYDGEEYAKFLQGDGPVYNPDECPQGVSVTYYDGIYSRGFTWSTNDAVSVNNLEYVKAEDGQDKESVDWSKAVVIPASMKESVDVEDVTWHLFKAHVENLEEGCKYFFRAGHVDTGYSDIGSFVIENSSESIDKLTFVHLTDCQEDSQSGYVKWSKVLDAAYNKAPDTKFVAFTGDLTNDSHQSLSMKQWIWGLNEPKKTLLDSVIMPVAGNHDNYDYSFTDRFDINWADYDNGDVTDQRTGGCYSFTYGDDIAFFALNTNDSDGGEETFGTQKQWLIGELEKYKDCKWKIVEVHKGMMSTGDHTNDGEVDWLRDILPPLFSEYDVDLVLQGHDHVYTRSRTYYYGEDFDGNLYSGQEPCWLDGEIINNYNIGGVERMVNLEPSGTHYVTINFCASKTYPVTKELDEVIYTGKNPFEDNGCSVQPNLPMYGVVQIDGDTLTYDAYTYNSSSKESTLYDTFTVDKNNDRGYRDRNEGKEEVEFIEGITVDSKKYDGKPVSFNLKGFVCSVPEIIDYSTLEFKVEGRNGTVYSSTTELPREVGAYTLNISISTKNRYYYGVSSIDFEITK